MKLLQNMWCHARAAYKTPFSKNTLTCDLVQESQIGNVFGRPINFIYFQTVKDYMYIVSYENKIIISFRGTDSSLAHRSNLRIWEEFCPKSKDGKHDGFWNSWCELRKLCFDTIIYLLKASALSNKPIYITGHSRGGTFAYYLAKEIAGFEEYDLKLSVITFGTPKPGTKSFREEYNSSSINTTRVYTRFDIVPTLPPHVLNFRHVGNGHKLRQPWYMKFFYKTNHIKEYSKILFKEKG